MEVQPDVIEVQPDWLALGVAILLATAAAAWRFAGLRGELVRKWDERIDVAKAGLSERATELLAEMQGEIADLLGTGEPFDPLDVVKDPAVLKSQASDFIKLIRLRDRADARVKLLLRLGPMGLVASILFGVGIAAIFLNVSDAVKSSWMLSAGRWLAIVGGAVLFLDFVVYSYLQNFLSNVELRSRPE